MTIEVGSNLAWVLVAFAPVLAGIVGGCIILLVLLIIRADR